MRIANQTENVTLERMSAILRYGIAALLLIAAFLKSHKLATRPSTEIDMFTSKAAMLLVVQFELILAVWLLGGWFRRVSWFVTVMCFSSFLAVTAHRAWIGSDSCGCFGVVGINPWITLNMDAAILLGLLFCKADWCAESNERAAKRIGIGIASYAAVGIAIATWIMSYTPSYLSADGIITGSDGLVLLEPEKWVGKPLPLLEFVDESIALASGDWEIMFHKHDCSKCQEVVPIFVRESNAQRALIEIPPFDTDMMHQRYPATLDLRLRPDYDWFMTTPVQMHLSNGVVTSVKSNFH